VSSDLTPKQVAQLAKVVKQELKPKMFEELLESVREGGAILRGQKKALRRFEVRASGIRAIRERTSLSQSEFARLIGVSVKTLQDWEQDRGCLGGAGGFACQLRGKRQHSQAKAPAPPITKQR
jgi:putative transcriptional regulator